MSVAASAPSTARSPGAARLDRVLLALGVGVLEASALGSFELFRTLALTVGGLLLAYVLVRPSLVLTAWRWASGRRRAALAVAGTAVLLVASALVADAARHPAVDLAGARARWVALDVALGRVVAADLRGRAAPPAGRAAAVTELRLQADELVAAVLELERVRPPDDLAPIHATAVAISREIADLVLGLPGALERDDADAGAAIWRAVARLTQESGALVLLTQSP